MKDLWLSIKEFELLLDALQKISNSYNHTLWTTMGLLVVTLGWLVTSDDARYFIGDNFWIKMGSIAFLGVIFLIHIGILIDLSIKSRELSSYLTEQSTLTNEMISKFSIKAKTIKLYFPLISGFINGGLIFLIIAIIIFYLEL